MLQFARLAHYQIWSKYLYHILLSVVFSDKCFLRSKYSYFCEIQLCMHFFFFFFYQKQYILFTRFSVRILSVRKSHDDDFHTFYLSFPLCLSEKFNEWYKNMSTLSFKMKTETSMLLSNCFPHLTQLASCKGRRILELLVYYELV